MYARSVFEADYDSASLLTQFPPKFTGNKLYVYRKVNPKPKSQLTAMQFEDNGVPLKSVRDTVYAYEPEYYDYTDTDGWYVNFADPTLFGFYETDLMAQDEVQVLEHCVLASVRARLGGLARTVDGGRATPWLFSGVERFCRVAAYGNSFCKMTDVDGLVTVLDPPQLVNIACMAAPRDEDGTTYTESDIYSIVRTAAVTFSAVLSTGGTRVHTGNWGCGAFGNNPTVMVACQMLGARAAGLSQLVVHASDAFERAAEIASNPDFHAAVLSMCGMKRGSCNGT